jgi:hypothetical protein
MPIVYGSLGRGASVGALFDVHNRLQYAYILRHAQAYGLPVTGENGAAMFPIRNLLTG